MLREITELLMKHSDSSWKKPSDIEELLNCSNLCLMTRKSPQEWKHALVALIYKSGDAKLAENYRPISLLNAGYKIYASMLQYRLQKALDSRLRENHFGFRRVGAVCRQFTL